MTDKHVTDPLIDRREERKRWVPQDFQEEEISLIDLWRVIAKRKRLILITVAVILLLVGAWLLIAKPVYESRAVLGLGQVGQVAQVAQVAQVEAPQLLVQRLKEEYRVKDQSEGEQKFPAIKEVKTMEKSLANGVEIIVQAHEPQEAQKFLTDVVAKVIKRHQKLFDMGRAEQIKQMESLQQEYERIEQALVLIEHRISALVGSEASLAGLLTLQKDLLLQRLPQLAQQQATLRLAMSELQSTPTFMLRTPTLPIEPVSPKPVLYMTLAGVVGLMLGIFGAFFAEFVGKTRKQLQATSEDKSF